jgi:hypothetical protein
MRGEAERQIGMLTLVTPEQRVRDDHPLRRVKPLAEAALKDLSPTFDTGARRPNRFARFTSTFHQESAKPVT